MVEFAQQLFGFWLILTFPGIAIVRVLGPDDGLLMTTVGGGFTPLPDLGELAHRSASSITLIVRTDAAPPIHWARHGILTTSLDERNPRVLLDSLFQAVRPRTGLPAPFHAPNTREPAGCLRRARTHAQRNEASLPVLLGNSRRLLTDSS